MRVRHVLFILVLTAILFFLSGCQSPVVDSPVPDTPILSPTASLGNTLSPTETPIPTLQPSPSADPAEVQLKLLYQSSLKYLAKTDEQAWEVAKSLGYAPLGGYPSNMCGPLAVSILKDSGILGPDVDLHDFWLLDPSVDNVLLQTVFPTNHFEWLHNDLPINEIDYKQFPLKAGDMVYIYSGYQGDYSHVLTVTRVDEDGRAYSVTNNYTAQGFVVLEYMLYDPAHPGEGIFYDWPDPANRGLGLTGFGGMDVWRPISLPYYAGTNQ